MEGFPFVIIDKEWCSGCGRCGESVPDIFLLDVDAGISTVHEYGVVIETGRRALSEGELQDVQVARDECPTGSIVIQYE